MKKTTYKPFNVSYTFSFSGKTKSDGVKTLTPQIIRDKMLDVLENLLRDQYIDGYSVSAQIDKKNSGEKGMKDKIKDLVKDIRKQQAEVDKVDIGVLPYNTIYLLIIERGKVNELLKLLENDQ